MISALFDSFAAIAVRSLEMTVRTEQDTTTTFTPVMNFVLHTVSSASCRDSLACTPY